MPVLRVKGAADRQRGPPTSRPDARRRGKNGLAKKRTANEKGIDEGESEEKRKR